MSWQTYRLGDVITLKRGHDLPEAQRQDGEVPVVSSSGITGYHNEPKAKAPGVVTGRYGTLGEVFYIEQDYWPLNTASPCDGFQGNHPRFVAYFLQNVLRNYQSDKAAVPGVNRNDLHDMASSNGPTVSGENRLYPVCLRRPDREQPTADGVAGGGSGSFIRNGSSAFASPATNSPHHPRRAGGWSSNPLVRRLRSVTASAKGGE